MHYSLQGRQSDRRLLWLGLGASLAVSLLAIVLLVLRPAPAVAPVATVEPKATPIISKDGSLVSKMLFVGDVMWGRAVQTRAQSSGQSYSWITSGLTKADRGSYDAWIANFECPITTKDVPYKLQIDILKFNCRPEYLPNLAKWFTAASQANNHTMNVDGQWGIEQTRVNLEKAGIQHFGNYDMTKQDDICEVIAMPATTAKTHKKVSLPVALCGFMQVVNVAPTDTQLAVMQKYAKVMPVIAFPHMGVEFRGVAEPEKVSAYHRMIDNGADAVIAAHPHVIQNSESYKGHLIAYSLGNFLFDQQVMGRDTTVGLGVGLKLTIPDKKTAKIYEAIAPTCKTYRDSCLAQLTAKLPTRPKIDVAYSFTCYDESIAVGRVPQIGSKAVCDLARRQATVDKLGSLSKQW